MEEKRLDGRAQAQNVSEPRNCCFVVVPKKQTNLKADSFYGNRSVCGRLDVTVSIIEENVRQ